MDLRSYNIKQSSGKGTNVSQIDTPVIEKAIDEAHGMDKKAFNAGKSVLTENAEDEDAPPLQEKDIIEEYLKFLAEKNITPDGILKVLDNLVTNGTVYWDCKLFGRIPVVFEVRSMWINQLITKKLEEAQPKTWASYQEIISLNNLAGSLIEYNGKQMPLDKTEDFERNLIFIQRLSLPMVDELRQQLAVFDRVITVATSSWCLTNFTTPPLAA